MNNFKNLFSHRALILGIAGCTNSGKTTLSNNIVKKFQNCKIKIISQDDYYMTKEHVKTIKSVDNSEITFYDYDSIEALNLENMILQIKDCLDTYDFIIVEGNMITDVPKIMEFITFTFFLNIDKQLCLKRRLTRNYEPPDKPGYFEQIVWPSYLKTKQSAQKLDRIKFIKIVGDLPSTDKIFEMIDKQFLNLIWITENPIDINQTINFVQSDNCGAISSFTGVTKNTFKEKEVIYLEYESYYKMSYLMLRILCDEVRFKFLSIEKIAIFHRTGVKVGECSIVISTSSPQRKDAIDATKYLIDNIKKSIPIWKKEVYADGSYLWKENKESLTNFC